MKDKIVEILRDEFLTEISLDEIYQRSAERIDQLYSAGEDVSDDDIMEEADKYKMDYVLAVRGSAYFAFANGAKWMRSKLTRPTVSEEIWNKLRERYFEECCEIKPSCYVPPPMDVPTSMKRVALAPHDLFEWFKAAIKELLNR